jgi:hypothetical protein
MSSRVEGGRIEDINFEVEQHFSRDLKKRYSLLQHVSVDYHCKKVLHKKIAKTF